MISPQSSVSDSLLSIDTINFVKVVKFNSHQPFVIVKLNLLFNTFQPFFKPLLLFNTLQPFIMACIVIRLTHNNQYHLITNGPFHQPTIQEKIRNLTEVLDYIVLIVVI